MTAKFKLLSYRANETIATIERGANAAGEMPVRGWFRDPTVLGLEHRLYVFIDREATDDRKAQPVTLTNLGREYRAWAKTKD